MSSPRHQNVGGAEVPGRRTVHGMCGMRGVRCPIEVTVEDGRMTWLQGNPHDKWITPGTLEAMKPGRMQAHGSTEEVPG